VVGKFLYRPGFRALIHSLRDQGLIFYQTFTETKISQGGPSNPDYLLRRNELLALCDGMNILVYREEDKVGDVCQGWRNQAMIIAQK
ncbi:MAG: SAM-dependent methyltransferase, partial [Pseudomonadota bacterium]